MGVVANRRSMMLLFTGLVIHKPHFFGMFSFPYMVNIHNVLGFILLINAALALTVTSKMGIPLDKCIAALEKFSGVKGRFDLICTKPFSVIIDYAHTPDSLTAILQDARRMTGRRLLCLFGCTGERDREKRPVMGAIAAVMADYSIITSDDTYDEDPLAITHQVESGFIKNDKIAEIGKINLLLIISP